jgi:biotin carboxyl carrier protein
MPDRHHIVVDSRSFVVERHADGVVVDDDSAALVRATAEGDGRYRIDVAGRPHHAIAAAAGDRIWIAIDGEVFECRLAAQPRIANDDRLSSPMPATVTAIPIRVGQGVEAGDVLIALEAMKMELPLRAPHKGTVAAVHCHVGDLVQPDVVLVELLAERPDVS